ncbi:hypothetical protein DL765_009015 [Monosporascus sp. GIB2]|nr:hypothetical protein DL765_009015 [Monosporascus sp. GIB2]
MIFSDSNDRLVLNTEIDQTRVSSMIYPGSQADLHDSFPPDAPKSCKEPSSVIRDVKPDAISDFQWLQDLGTGAFAQVDMVEFKGKVYARKTFKVAGDMNRARQSFKTEVSILKKLSEHRHQHIVHFVDAFTCEEKKKLYLIMFPAANQGNLQQYLRRIYNDHGVLADDAKLFLRGAIQGLARGLAFIHKTTIRHKDISPLNILIHNGLVLYADFGVAFDFCAAKTSTTESVHPQYNFQYAAPELLERQSRNHKSDVFSLGCIYFEIIARYLGEADLKVQTVYEDGIAYGLPESVDKLQEVGRYSMMGDLCGSMLRKERDARPSATQVESGIVDLEEKVEMRPTSELRFFTSTSSWYQQNQTVSYLIGGT